MELTTMDGTPSYRGSLGYGLDPLITTRSNDICILFLQKRKSSLIHPMIFHVEIRQGIFRLKRQKEHQRELILKLYQPF